MADNDEGEETARKGNEWEVVSLTASTYAAAPGPKEISSSQESDSEDKDETSDGMFMSDHFVFPPSQHENLPIEPEHIKPLNEKVCEYDASPLVTMEGNNSFAKDEDNLSIEELMSREFPEIQTLDEKGNRMSSSGVDFEKDIILNEEKKTFSTTESRSFHHGATNVNSSSIKEGEPEENESDSGSQKHNEGDKYYKDDLPCEAWWKRRALSVYVHAKEANTFWSIFIAAAVMGIVIIGHQWQQERWKVLHLKWQFGVNDKMMGRILGPISRLKHVVIGGHRQGSLVRGSTTREL